MCVKQSYVYSGQLIVYLYCTDCHKNYKIQLSTIFAGREFQDVSVKAENCNVCVCVCLKKTNQICGADRDVMKEKLELQTPSQLQALSFLKPLPLSFALPPKVGTLHKILYEKRGSDDLDMTDPVNDVFFRYQSKKLSFKRKPLLHGSNFNTRN